MYKITLYFCLKSDIKRPVLSIMCNLNYVVMKNLERALMSVFVLLLVSSCKPEGWKNNADYRKHPGKNVVDDTLIIRNIVHEKGHCESHGCYDIYLNFLSNGMEVELDGPHQVNFLNTRLEIVQSEYRDAELRRWKRARVGQKVIYSKHYNSSGKLKAVSFELLPFSDYTKHRVVKEVRKYDGNMSELNGNYKSSDCLVDGSASGIAHGKNAGSEDFFVNIYFTEGEPLSINAKMNSLFLDVRPGDVIIESCQNGSVDYAIKRQ